MIIPQDENLNKMITKIISDLEEKIDRDELQILRDYIGELICHGKEGSTLDHIRVSFSCIHLLDLKLYPLILKFKRY